MDELDWFSSSNRNGTKEGLSTPGVFGMLSRSARGSVIFSRFAILAERTTTLQFPSFFLTSWPKVFSLIQEMMSDFGSKYQQGKSHL